MENQKHDYFIIYPIMDHPLLSTSYECYAKYEPSIAKSFKFSRKGKKSEHLCKNLPL